MYRPGTQGRGGVGVIHPWYQLAFPGAALPDGTKALSTDHLALWLLPSFRVNPVSLHDPVGPPHSAFSRPLLHQRSTKEERNP